MRHCFVITLLVFVVSCGTFRKELQEHKLLKRIESSALVDSVKNSARELASLMKTKQYAYSDTGVTKIVETKFSSPDSLGRQHKLSEKITEHSNNIEIKAQELEQKLEEVQRISEQWEKRYQQIAQELESEKSLKTKTKTTPPLWLFVLCFLLGFLICFFALRKMNLGEWIMCLLKKVLSYGG